MNHRTVPVASALSCGALVRAWGLVPYDETFAAMQAFTAARGPDTPDEFWWVAHPPVFTQGVAGKAEHVLGAGDIPVVQTNRGGQVTYHGPGQVVAYPLIDLRRQGIFVKEYVFRIEQAVIKTLEGYGVTGLRVPSAPGIYVRTDDPFSHAALTGPLDPAEPFRGLGKISALGIKVTQHRTYHGVALNVAPDMEHFRLIVPCGIGDRPVASMAARARILLMAMWVQIPSRAAPITIRFSVAKVAILFAAAPKMIKLMVAARTIKLTVNREMTRWMAASATIPTWSTTAPTWWWKPSGPAWSTVSASAT